MKLEILINHYKEPPEILRRLLDSINEQTGISTHDVSALICTDGYEYELPSDIFCGYSFPIQYYVRPHKGVCATRNTLIDKANGDYLMFCDCDDVFSSSKGLQEFFSLIGKSDADIIGSDYSVELKTDTGFSYRTCHEWARRVHGKFFRRRYLLEQNLRFPDEMMFSGDMYFLYLAYHLTQKTAWISDNFYIWKWMPESVTRGKEYYRIRTYKECTTCYELILKELQSRGYKDLYDSLLMSMFFNRYIDWHSDSFVNAPEHILKLARSAICVFVRTYRKSFYLIPEAKRHKSYIQYLLSRRTYGPPTKYIGLDGWIDVVSETNSF